MATVNRERASTNEEDKHGKRKVVKGNELAGNDTRSQIPSLQGGGHWPGAASHSLVLSIFYVNVQKIRGGETQFTEVGNP